MLYENYYEENEASETTEWCRDSLPLAVIEAIDEFTEECRAA